MNYDISNVGLIVDDVVGAADYYSECYGHTRKQDIPEFVEFDGKKATFFLWQRSHLSENIGEEKLKHAKYPLMMAIFFETREDLDKAFQNLRNKNIIQFYVNRGFGPWSAYAAYYVDAYGFLWELYTWIEK